MGNTAMIDAKRNANDEFYTQLEDINRELNHYREHFKGKHIFMNCDDPEESDFWKYFYLNFEFLGIRKITSTHYHDSEPTYRLDYDGEEIIKSPLEQNGDFRSPEAIEILKEADIIVTNPPFSLYREYLAQLIEYEKDFLIIGNFASITYKEVFPLIKEDKIWIGVSPRSMTFRLPDGSEKDVNAAWFTNLEVERRHEDIILYETYVPEKYPTYDNYDAIEVSRVNQIPKDYDGVMGVPITFLARHNPKQFKILDVTNGRNDFEVSPTKKYENAKQINPNGTITNGSKVNTGAMMLLNEEPKSTYYTADNADGPLKRFYTRILIQRKSDD